MTFSKIPDICSALFHGAKSFIDTVLEKKLTKSCLDALTPLIDKLISSSDVNANVLSTLSQTVVSIVDEFAPDQAATLKCEFMKQFAKGTYATKLLVDLKFPPQMVAAAAGEAATCPAGSPLPGAAAAVKPPPPPPPEEHQALQQQPPPPLSYQPPPPPPPPLSLEEQQHLYEQYQQQPALQQRYYQQHPQQQYHQDQDQYQYQQLQQPPPPTFLAPQLQHQTSSHNLRKGRGGVERPESLGPPGKKSRWDRGETRWDQRKGGSSKHKKKHPRTTNKRKLLVKRVRRRSMKNKKKGKW